MLFSPIRIDDDGTFYVSGQLPSDMTVGLKEQTASSLANMDAILSEAGITRDQIRKMSVFEGRRAVFVWARIIAPTS